MERNIAVVRVIVQAADDAEKEIEMKEQMKQPNVADGLTSLTSLVAFKDSWAMDMSIDMAKPCLPQMGHIPEHLE